MPANVQVIVEAFVHIERRYYSELLNSLCRNWLRSFDLAHERWQLQTEEALILGPPALHLESVSSIRHRYRERQVRSLGLEHV